MELYDAINGNTKTNKCHIGVVIPHGKLIGKKCREIPISNSHTYWAEYNVDNLQDFIMKFIMLNPTITVTIMHALYNALYWFL